MDWTVTLPLQNRFPEARDAVVKFADIIAQRSGISGIASVGGLARGYVDKHSDLDLLVFGDVPGLGDLAWDFLEGMIKKGFLAELPPWAEKGALDVRDSKVWSFVKFRASPNKTIKELRIPELDPFIVDLELLDLESVRSGGPCEHWLLEYRWMLGHAWIPYDPSGAVQELFTEAARYHPEDQTADLNDEAEAVHVAFHQGETWILRGDPLSASFSIHGALDHLVSTLYIARGVHVPYGKWKAYYVRNLLPQGDPLFQELSACLASPGCDLPKLRKHLERCRELKRKLYDRFDVKAKRKGL
ncbi:MAG: nucleotidyltransferase domain-containing protein [Armatimonadetes bacterium]|nr:nucleotidyltransferase domain-containing protein [Armatimonadota bacterium]